MLFFNFRILRTVALKAALNGGRPKFCLGVIRAGVKGAGVIRANKVVCNIGIRITNKSHISLLNSSGPSTDPCGTPYKISYSLVNEEPILTFCDLPQ